MKILKGDATPGNIEQKQSEKHGAKTKDSQVAVRHIRNLRKKAFELFGENKIGETLNNQNES